MNLLKCAAFSLALVVPIVSFAQAPGGAPAGSTGQCKDGSYSSASSKRGACAGHQGVKDWYAVDAGAPAATTNAPAAAAPTAPPAPAVTPMAKTASPTTTPATKVPAAGGGAGQVWVNTSSKVYHCPGTKNYGTTKAGEYMTEAAAKTAGARPDHGKACTS